MSTGLRERQRAVIIETLTVKGAKHVNIECFIATGHTDRPHAATVGRSRNVARAGELLAAGHSFSDVAAALKEEQDGS